MNFIAIDLDGTILDSSLRHRIVLDGILNDFCIKIDTDKYLEYKKDGFSTMEFLLSEYIDKNTARAICAKWLESIENKEYLKHDRLYSETIKVLEKLSSKYKLVLTTARNNAINAMEQINELKISNYFYKFKIVNSNSHTSESKSKELKKYELKYYIGDTETDYNAAKNLNVKFLALNRGFRSQKYWDKINLSSYNSLTDILKEIGLE